LETEISVGASISTKPADVGVVHKGGQRGASDQRLTVAPVSMNMPLTVIPAVSASYRTDEIFARTNSAGSVQAPLTSFIAALGGGSWV
jgi:hypothetical protein